MAGVLGLFARCFAIGVAVAAPVGAMGAMCIGRTLRGGPRYGLATGLGIASADAMYGAVAAFGITAVSSLLAAWTVPLRVVGGLVLLFLGFRAATSAPSLDAPADVRHPLALYSSALALTLTNPTTILEFGIIFASAGLVAVNGDVARAFAATFGIAGGSLAWWLVLVAAVSAARSRVGDRTLLMINRVSGAVIAGFGVVVLASLLMR